MGSEFEGRVPNLDGDNWHEAYNAICEYYRLALFNSLYSGRMLARRRRTNWHLEVWVAVLIAAVAALTAPQSPLHGSIWLTALAAAVAALAAVKPVLRLTDDIARYSSEHMGYRELYLAYHALLPVIKIESRVTTGTWSEHLSLVKRYRELSSDPNPPIKVRVALKAEVERQIPIESLQLNLSKRGTAAISADTETPT